MPTSVARSLSPTLVLLLACLVAFPTISCPSSAEDVKPVLSTTKPLSPRDEQATFRLPKGFKIELAACEPEVVDPVAFAFDENGRLFVAEMHGYPNEGVGTGTITSGKVKLLQDKDGDGFFEKSTVFAEGLRFPTSVMPWKGGLLVANAPELLYLEDTDGDGRADRRRILYTGFELANIQQLLNSLQWGLDNWVHGVAGNTGGLIRSGEKKDAAPVTLRSRGVRFHPDKPASLEPTSGGGQFGLAADDWGRWFTATNSQHLRHIVLPDHYLRRNPYLPVSAVTIDIPDHGPACKVHRISPFEAWRVERTTRRKGGADAKRFAATELVPGGFITSACSPLVYNADLFPEPYRGTVFVCDPANNLIHRDLLQPKGATFVAVRADADCEFLASTDNWFRPVNLTIGPDGGMYIADFYREVIETPLSLPDDIKKRLNLESRSRGRIWRVVTDSYDRRGTARPRLGEASSAELVRHLVDANVWWRLNAQRLLVERQDQGVVPQIRRLAQTSKFSPGRAHALWTLHGLGALAEEDVEVALRDAEAGVREQAIRLAESRLSTSPKLRTAVASLTDDPSPRVRFQLAFTLGEAEGPELTAAWVKMARRDGNDSWTQTALLSSASQSASALLATFSSDQKLLHNASSAHLQMLTRLAMMVGARAEDNGLAQAFRLLSAEGNIKPAAWQVAVLEGLGQGLQNSQRSLEKLWQAPPPALQKAVEGTRPFFAHAAELALEEKTPAGDRTAAVRLLGYGPFAVAAGPLQELLSPTHPQDVQLAAVRALSAHTNAKVAGILLDPWTGYSPAVRREVLEALFARKDRLKELLRAIEQKKVLAGQLDPSRLDQLRKYPDLAMRKQALKLLTGQVAPDRLKIVQAFQDALELKADPSRGKVLFKKTCATCHRLENEGTEVGPDLQAVLRNKTAEALLIDILDPSREVDPRFLEYLVETKAGRVFTGAIAAETAASLTLRRAEKAEDTILRNQVDSIRATAKSLMPEGLEMQLSRQDVADVIAYLQAVARQQ
jgi:putative membrane-bound dehydrogenase-like protein